MTPHEFFEIIKPYGWGTLTTDDEAISRKWAKKFTDSQLKEMKDCHSFLFDHLYERLFDFVSNIGDDEFCDLINHIIGLGETEYNDVLNNPNLAQKRIDSCSYEESFLYCFYAIEEKKKASPQFLFQAAKTNYEKFEVASKMPLPNVAEDFKNILDSLQTFMYNIIDCQPHSEWLPEFIQQNKDKLINSENRIKEDYNLSLGALNAISREPIGGLNSFFSLLDAFLAIIGEKENGNTLS